MTIGFCSGSFDLLHPGHVRFLEACRARCDHLVVMVGTDRQIKHAKGKYRPVLGQNARLAMVQALRCVDNAFIDKWDRLDLSGLTNACDFVRPDLYFSPEAFGTGSAAMRVFWIGRAYKVPLYVPILDKVEGFSTTAIVNHIRRTGAAQ